MRTQTTFSLLLLGGITAFALMESAAQGPGPVGPAKLVESPAGKNRDLTKLTPQQTASLIALRRTSDWLRRTNKPDGRFVYGFLPDLRVPLEGDSYIAQAGAAFALAQSARFLGDEKALAISRQALLTLLLETTLDPKNKEIRHTAAPAALVNRLAAHGLLVAAIHELPSPGKDLLEQADQLCNYLQRQQEPDGSLRDKEAGGDPKAGPREEELISAGLALQGVMSSQTRQPAAWKLDMARKTAAYTQAGWQQKKSVTVAVSQTPALTQAYLATEEKVFADLVFAMNDWLCTMQYEAGESVRSDWIGGFRVDGPAAAPDIRSAAAAESVAEACRLARAAGDLPRLQRYTRTLESGLQFVLSLQYSESRAQHFVETFRPAVVGAFHASGQDGKIRVDYAQHPVSALVRHLEE